MAQLQIAETGLVQNKDLCGAKITYNATVYMQHTESMSKAKDS